MAATTYFCVKNDSTVSVVTFDSDANTCHLFNIFAWINQQPPELEGNAVYGWAEEQAPKIEAIYPYRIETQTVDLRESEIIEVSELMDDLRDF